MPGQFRNFSGNADRFNAKGARNFKIALPDEDAKAMESDGWNIKWLQPREEEDAPLAILKVNVKYSERGRPPQIVMITSRGKTPLTEDMIDVLDWADIEDADVQIRAYHYDINGKTGISAYLNTLYVTIREDELALRYMDVPDAEGAREPDESPGD
jgi:hypothetical protein